MVECRWPVLTRSTAPPPRRVSLGRPGFRELRLAWYRGLTWFIDQGTLDGDGSVTRAPCARSTAVASGSYREHRSGNARRVVDLAIHAHTDVPVRAGGRVRRSAARDRALP